MSFRGWQPNALDFFVGIEADNSKRYWTEHKSDYEEYVKAPFLALSGDIEKEFGPLHLFRPYRDTRFAKDKSPYKTALGAVGESERAAHFYLQISAAGLFVASGFYHLSSDQLERYRAAVDDARKGAQLVKVVREVEQVGLEVHVRDALKTAPRGYPKDHPRVELLRGKGLTAGTGFPIRKWLHTAAVREKVVQTWSAARPLYTWLERHVGPSTEAPPEPD